MRWLLAIAFVACIAGCSNGEVERLQVNVDELEDRISLLEAALEEANSRIQQAADDISSLQLEAIGGDYDSLQFAVQMLDEPETVREP